MKKIDIHYQLLIAFGLVFIVVATLGSIGKHKSIIVKTPIIENVDSSHFTIDTVRAIKMNHLTNSNLYDLHCKMCHGVQGKGDGVKARFDTTICPYNLSKVTKPDKEIYYIVLNGEQKMPNQYEIDTTDVWVIVVYIKKFRK